MPLEDNMPSRQGQSRSRHEPDPRDPESSKWTGTEPPGTYPAGRSSDGERTNVDDLYRVMELLTPANWDSSSRKSNENTVKTPAPGIQTEAESTRAFSTRRKRTRRHRAMCWPGASRSRCRSRLRRSSSGSGLRACMRIWCRTGRSQVCRART